MSYQPTHVSYDTDDSFFQIKRLLPYFVIPGIILLILLAYLGLNFASGTHEVSIVNGTNQAYDFKLNGKTIHLNPGQRLEYDLPYGESHIEPISGEVPVADQTITNSRSFLLRVFDSRVVVVNPDQVAILSQLTGHFAKNVNSAPEDEVDIFVGEVLYVFEDIDYEFTVLPNSISTQQTSGVISKTSLEMFASTNVLGDIVFLMAYCDEGTVEQYIRQLAVVTPRLPDLPRAAYTLLSEDAFHEVAGTMLDRRPVMTAWHRTYQSHMEEEYPEVDLETRYREMFETSPDNGDLAYLYARRIDDPEERRRLYAIGTQSNPPLAWSLYGEAFLLTAEAQFEDALVRLEQVCAMEPENSTFAAARNSMYHAAGHYEELIEPLRTTFHEDAYVDDAMGLIQYLIRNGDEHEVQAESQFLLQEVSAAMQAGLYEDLDMEDPMGYTQIQIDLAIALGRGRLEDTAQQFELLGGPFSLTAAALLTGEVDTAHELLFADPELYWIDDYLALYIQSIRQNGVEGAVRERDLLISELQRYDRDYNQLALWISGEDTVTYEGIVYLALEEAMRPLALVVVGLQFPVLKDACFEMAKKQNFSIGFTRLLIDDVLSD